MAVVAGLDIVLLEFGTAKFHASILRRIGSWQYIMGKANFCQDVTVVVEVQGVVRMHHERRGGQVRGDMNNGCGHKRKA